jgi:hypothetical protein
MQKEADMIFTTLEGTEKYISVGKTEGCRRAWEVEARVAGCRPHKSEDMSL